MSFLGGKWLDRSGEIEQAEQSQLLMEASSKRLGWWIQNLSAKPLWINFDEPAVCGRGSMRIGPYGFYEEGVPGRLTDQAIYITGPETGQEFTAKEM